MNKRALKRFKRENRPDKGVGTAAKVQARRDAVRNADNRRNSIEDMTLLLAAGMLNARRNYAVPDWER